MTPEQKAIEKLKAKHTDYVGNFSFQVTAEEREKIMNWKKEGYSIARCLRLLVDDAPFSFESF